jgi:hypothetical protein
VEDEPSQAGDPVRHVEGEGVGGLVGGGLNVVEPALVYHALQTVEQWKCSSSPHDSIRLISNSVLALKSRWHLDGFKNLLQSSLDF